MMKALHILLLSLIIPVAGIAQTGAVPNSGMETWTNYFFIYDEPNGWTTSNQLKLLDFNNPVTVFKSTDKYSGTYAARIETKAFPTAPAEEFDTLGFMLSGTIDFNTGDFKGFPYSSRPAKLSYYMKYAPAAGDTGGVYTQLTKWDASLGTRILVASGGTQFTQAAGSYTLRETELIYLTSDVPDSALIIFASSDFLNTSPQAGSVLFIDQVNFTGTATSIGERASSVGVKAFPNPCTTELSFEAPAEAVKIVAVSILGRETMVIPVTNGKAKLETSALPPGAYFYRVFDGNGAAIHTGKFSVIK